MSQDLDALIADLEAATEGSAIFDARIEVAVGCAPAGWLGQNFNRFEARGNRVYAVHDDGTVGAHWAPPCYTTSVNAALTLVPAECWGVVEWSGEPRSEAGGRSWPIVRLGSASCPELTAQAITLPLSICIAALKSRRAANG